VDLRGQLAAKQADPEVGIPVLSTAPGGNLDEEYAQIECETCGQKFRLNDPEALAYHEQEMHEIRVDDVLGKDGG
jgi:hypothetical protein